MIRNLKQKLIKTYDSPSSSNYRTEQHYTLKQNEEVYLKIELDEISEFNIYQLLLNIPTYSEDSFGFKLESLDGQLVFEKNSSASFNDVIEINISDVYLKHRSSFWLMLKVTRGTVSFKNDYMYVVGTLIDTSALEKNADYLSQETNFGINNYVNTYNGNLHSSYVFKSKTNKFLLSKIFYNLKREKSLLDFTPTSTNIWRFDHEIDALCVRDSNNQIVGLKLFEPEFTVKEYWKLDSTDKEKFELNYVEDVFYNSDTGDYVVSFNTYFELYSHFITQKTRFTFVESDCPSRIIITSIEKIENNERKTIYYTYDGINVSTIMVDDDVLSFTYENNHVTKLSFINEDFQYTIYYLEDLISKISIDKKDVTYITYSSGSTVEKEILKNILIVNYEYDNKKLVSCKNNLENSYYEYVYNDRKITDIKQYFKGKLFETIKLNYNSNYSIISNSTDSVTKFYNKFGISTNSINDKGNSINKNIKIISPNGIAEKVLVGGSTMPTYFGENLIRDNQFELDGADWIFSDLSKISYSNSSLDGGKCLTINNTSEFSIKQLINIQESGKYNFFAYIKSNSSSGETTFNIYVNNVKRESLISNHTYDSWQHKAIFDIDLAKGDSVIVEIISTEIGLIMLDDLQLINGFVLRNVNYIKNGKFNNFNIDKKPLNWDLKTNKSSVSINENLELYNINKTLSKNVLTISAIDDVTLSQTLKLNGRKNDSITLNLWIKSKQIEQINVKILFFNKDNECVESKQETLVFEKGYWSLLTLGTIVLSNFEKVRLELILGYTDEFLITDIQLLKNAKTISYYSDENKSVFDSELSTYTLNDKGGLVKEKKNDNGTYNIFEYNSNGTLKKVTDSFGNTLENTYDSKGRNNMKKIISEDGILISENVYSDDELLLETYDNLGLVSKTEMDNQGVLKKIGDAEDYEKEFEYNELQQIIKVINKKAGVNVQEYNYTYYENGGLKSFVFPNGTVYYFDRDDYGRLLEIKINNIPFIKYTYFEDLQSLKLTKTEIFGNGKLTEYIYENGKLCFVKKDGVITRKMIYDIIGNLIKVFDGNNNLLKDYFRDQSGKIIGLKDGKTNVLYDYDNQNQVQNKILKCDDDTIIQSFDYETDFTDYTFDGFSRRMHLSYLCDVLKPKYSLNSLYGNKCINSNILTKSIDNYVVYSLTSGKQFIDFYKNKFNMLAEKQIYSKGLALRNYQNTLMCIFKTVNDSNFKLLGFTNSNGEEVSIKINNGKIILLYGTSEKFICDVSSGFNFVSLKIEKNDLNSYEGFKATVFANGTYISQMCYGVNISVYDKVFVGNNTESMSGSADIYIAYYSNYDFTLNDYNRINTELIKTIDKDIPKFNRGTNYSFCEKDIELIPLNGSFKTSNANLPFEYEEICHSYLSAKNNCFEYDKEFDNYVYGSYRNNIETISLNNKPLLKYRLITNKRVMISCNLYVLSKYNENIRTIFSLETEKGNIINLYLNENNNLAILKGETSYISTLTVTLDCWCKVALLIKENSIIIKYNNYEEELYLLNDENIKSLGIANDENNNCLDGRVSLVAISYNETNDMLNYNTTQNSVKTYFDSLGRGHKQIIKKDNEKLLSKEIKFKSKLSDSRYTSLIPSNENIDISNGNLNLEYDYYKDRKLKSVTINGDKTQYIYDQSGYLCNEQSTNHNLEILYNIGGNISEKKENNLNDEILFKYEYDENNKDLLTEIKKYKNDTLINTEYIKYSVDYYGKPIKYKNLEDIIWDEKDIKSLLINNKEMILTHVDNLLTKKVFDGRTTEYCYEGKFLVKEIVNGEKIIYIRDNTGELVSFQYNNNLYHYVKSSRGLILGVINNSGEMIVKYNYDAFGKILKIDTFSDEGDLISAVNNFVFMSAYYDRDLNLYLFKYRYYDFETGRFISSDNSIVSDGLIAENLFHYCNNDPINFVDKDGQFWEWIIAIIIAIIVVGFNIDVEDDVIDFNIGGCNVTSKVYVHYGKAGLININVATGSDWSFGLSLDLLSIGVGFAITSKNMELYGQFLLPYYEYSTESGSYISASTGLKFSVGIDFILATLYHEISYIYKVETGQGFGLWNIGNASQGVSGSVTIWRNDISLKVVLAVVVAIVVIVAFVLLCIYCAPAASAFASAVAKGLVALGKIALTVFVL